MAIVDGKFVFKDPGNRVTKTGERVIDYDTTVAGDGTIRREKGLDAPELGKISRLGQMTGNEAGAQELTDAASGLLDLHRFDQWETEGDKDVFGRELGRHKNILGQDFATFSHLHGLAEPGKYSDEEGLKASVWGDLVRGQKLYKDNTSNPVTAARVLVEESVDRAKELGWESYRQKETASDWGAYAIEKVKFSPENKKSLEDTILQNRELLKDPTLEPQVRQKLENEIDIAYSELQQIQYYGGPRLRAPIGIPSESGFFGQLGNASEAGLLMIQESWFSFNDYAGEALGIKGLEQYGEWGASQNKRKFAKLNPFIQELQQIEGPLDAFQWAANNVMLYGPQLVVTIGSRLAGAAVGTAVGLATAGPVGAVVGFGVGLTGPGIISIGQVWSEMPEGKKDVGLATQLGLAIGALDFFGVAGAGLTARKVLTKDGQRSFIKAIMDKNGLSEAAATLALKEFSIKQVSALGKEIVDMSTQLISKKRIATKLLGRITRQAGMEGGTEMAQEAIQSAGIHGMPETPREWDEFNSRLINAGATGGLLGGGFGIPGALGDRSQVLEAIRGQSEATDVNQELDSKWYDKNKERNGGIDPDLSTVIQQEVANNPDDGVQRDTVYNLGKNKKKQRTIWEGLTNVAKKPIRAFRSARRTAFEDHLNDEGFGDKKYLQIIANTYGAIKSFAGNSMPKEDRNNVGKIVSYTPDRAALQEKTGMNIQQQNDLVEKFRNNNQDLDKMTSEERKNLYKLNDEFKGMIDILRLQYNKTRGSDKHIQDELLKDFAFLNMNLPATSAIDLDPNGFLEYLKTVDRSHLGELEGKPISETSAKDIMEKYLNGETSPELMRALKGGDKKLLSKFMKGDWYGNSVGAAINQTRSLTREEFLGQGNSKLNLMLSKAIQNNELTREQAEDLAASLLEIHDIGNNRYNKWDSDLANNLQDTALTIATLSYMDLNLFSNFAEPLYSLLGTNATDDIINKWIIPFASNFGKEVYNNLKQGGAFLSNNKLNPTIEGSPFRALGYGIDAVGSISERESLNVTSKFAQNTNKVLFKANLVAPLTNSTKFARGGFALPLLSDMMLVLEGVDSKGPMTVEQREVLDRARYYGLEVDFALRKFQEIGSFDEDTLEAFFDFSKPDPERDQLFKNIDVFTTNFIDEMVVEIEPGSRPKGYDDKRLSLFTQYRGFVAAFTANIMPRVWKHIKKHKGQIGYKAAQLAVSTMIMAYMGQYLKDLIKYGGRTPHLSDVGQIRRALQYSSLTGSGEFVLDQLSPLYGRPYADTFLEGAAKTGLGESPSLSLITRQGGNIVDDLIEGEYGDAAAATLKFLPFISDSPDRRAGFGSVVDDIIGDK